IEKYKPDSWKGYTVGDNTHKEKDGHPWHADDEKLMYPFYEKISKTGIKNVCIHKGLSSPGTAEKSPRLLPYADVSDIGNAENTKAFFRCELSNFNMLCLVDQII